MWYNLFQFIYKSIFETATRFLFYLVSGLLQVLEQSFSFVTVEFTRCFLLNFLKYIHIIFFLVISPLRQRCLIWIIETILCLSQSYYFFYEETMKFLVFSQESSFNFFQIYQF